MNSTISFIKAITLMAASLANKDVTGLKTKYMQWVDEAQPFLKKHVLARGFGSSHKNFIKSKMEFTEDDALDLHNSIKEVMPRLIADTSIPQELLAIIKDVTLFFKKDSEPAWNRINKNISLLKDVDLTHLFTPDDEELSSEIGDLTIQAKMSRIVEKVVGRKNDPILTLNEIRDNRESNQKLIEQYSDLRKVFVINYKKALLKFVRASGKHTLDVKTVRKYLDALGCNYIPKGFVGSIDEQGRLYTVEGKQISGMLIGEVVMNPRYDAKKDNTYVCFLKSNPVQRLRTVDFIKGNKAARFDKVSTFMDDVDKFRTKWVKDLDSLDTKTQTIAAMVEAIYQTQARIGGDSKNKDGEERYGMSTLLVKQLIPVNGGFEFKYVGKKGTLQHHILLNNTPSNRKVIAIIKKLVKGKKQDDVVFTYRNAPIGSGPVNSYLKQLGVPAGITIHKFRHLAGTKLAMAILKKAPFKKTDKPTQSNVEKWLKEAMKEVGTKLQHRIGTGDKQKVTGMTAISAYISPQVMYDFFNGLGLRVPKWIPKI